MKKLNPFRYSNYRLFIDDFLKQKKMTYKQFVEKYRIVSFGFFSNIMAKDRSGNYRKTRKLSPELLIQLTKAMGFNDNESFYILLLSLENDSEVLKGKYGGALSSITRKHIKNYSKLNLLASDKFDDLYQRTGEVIKQLPLKYQKQVFKSILNSYNLAEDTNNAPININFDINTYFDEIKKVIKRG